MQFRYILHRILSNLGAHFSSRVIARAETRVEPLRTSACVEGYTSSGPVSYMRSAILTLMLQRLKAMQ